MNKVLLSLIAVATSVASAPAMAQEGWTFDAVAKAETGRTFAEQGFTLYKDPTLVADLTACQKGFCIDLWRAQTDARYAQETDITVWKDISLSKRVTLEPNLAFFEVPGKEIYRGRLKLTIEIGKSCSVSGNADVMVGGFETEVVRGDFGCSLHVVGPVGFNWQAGVGHDTAFNNTSGIYRVGFTVGDGPWQGALYGESYAPSSGKRDGFVGFSISRHFEKK